MQGECIRNRDRGISAEYDVWGVIRSDAIRLKYIYLYKSKAYKRNDTATIEVDTLEFSRLVLDGRNISFEELPCKDQQLSYEILNRKLKENIQIETFNQDTLKTLNLYNNVNGFNNAAGLLADKNHFSGIDIVKFGENISIIQKRVTFENVSVLEVYERAFIVFRDYYQYEIIQGADRKMMEKISEAAFRVAIYKSLSKTMLKPISEIAPYVPFGKSKTTQLLKSMEEKGVIAVEGKGRGTKYIIK